MIDGKPQAVRMEESSNSKKKVVRNIFFIQFLKLLLQLLGFFLVTRHTLNWIEFFSVYLIWFWFHSSHWQITLEILKMNYKIYSILICVCQIKIILFSYFNSIFSFHLEIPLSHIIRTLATQRSATQRHDWQMWATAHRSIHFNGRILKKWFVIQSLYQNQNKRKKETNSNSHSCWPGLAENQTVPLLFHACDGLNHL